MEYIQLNDGNRIPQLGYGVFTITDLAECEACVLDALAQGYRHIDTAQIYQNEQAVGNALAKCGIPREEIFLTTKIWVKSFGYEKCKRQIDNALRLLQTDYVDLMLLHRPFGDYKGAWRALEEAVKEGKIKSIGLSNFNIKQTKDILKIATITPAVNQIECQPFGQQRAWRSFLDSQGIKIESWYPLGHGSQELLTCPVFTQLAQKYGKTPAQVILRWHMQSGFVTFPCARSSAHRQENLDIFDFALTDEEMATINALDKDKYFFAIPDWVQKLTLLFQR